MVSKLGERERAKYGELKTGRGVGNETKQKRELKGETDTAVTLRRVGASVLNVAEKITILQTANKQMSPFILMFHCKGVNNTSMHGLDST